MKKSSLSAIRTALESIDFDASIIAEIDAELNKGQARKDANTQAYDAIHDVVMENLPDTPVTCAELWESIKNDVPEGTTKGKVQYALTHFWDGEIVTTKGKPNTYRRA